MNIVTIDPSILSTAVTINGKVFSIASERIALTKSLKYTKWFDICSPHCKIITVNTEYNQEKRYSFLEIEKLSTFQQTSNIIRKLVDKHCKPEYNTVVVIEGFSYSSEAGPLIDLVTFSTLVRRNLFSRANTELVVLAPSTIKRLGAMLTYEPIIKGKKTEYRNKQGIAGGSFKKQDIYKVLTENDNIQSDWVNFLREYEDVILKNKIIPKPIEDINDSVVMYYVTLQANDKCKKDFKDFISKLKEL